jgi:hypothetical protein
MTPATRATSVVRGSMMLCGGLVGAWTGGGGALHLPHNADGFGTLLAQGFFLGFALIGLTIGAVAGALIVTAVDATLRRLGVATSIAAGTAVVLTILTLWLIHGATLARYPGLRAETRTSEGWRPGINRNATLRDAVLPTVRQARSNRSSIMTLSHAFTKASTNASFASSAA